MYLSDLYQNKKSVLSLEIFPPKKNSSIESIVDVLEGMTAAKPDFVSVTYGASGNRETIRYSQMVASMIKNQYDTEVLFHLTCMNSDKGKIKEILQRLEKLNIKNILALRGDSPSNEEKLPNQQFNYATDLIEEIKKNGNFCIAAACYPEGHIDEKVYQNNFAYMKEKENVGTDFFISQLFFKNNYFIEFLNQARKFGINKPIVAGIMPILSKSQVDRMIYMCGVSLPSEIIRILHNYESNEDIRKAGIEHALIQAEQLLKEGVDGIHLYTMNHPDIATEGMTRFKKAELL